MGPSLLCRKGEAALPRSYPESQSTPSGIVSRASRTGASSRNSARREGLESPPTPSPAPESPGAQRCGENSSARGRRERLPAARRAGPSRPPHVTYDPHLLPGASERPPRFALSAPPHSRCRLPSPRWVPGHAAPCLPGSVPVACGPGGVLPGAGEAERKRPRLCSSLTEDVSALS